MSRKASYWVGGAGGWITFMGYFLSFLIAWWPFASDYSRYLPDEDHVSRATGVWTSALFIGQFACPLVVIALGGAVGGLAGALVALGAVSVVAAVAVRFAPRPAA